MPIFSDSAGFKYMGDCQWGTFNINYPSQYYLTSHPLDSISAELTALCTQSVLSFRNVASQSDFNARIPSGNPLNFLWFGANGDIDDRYAIGLSRSDIQNTGVTGLHVYNDSGSTNTTPASALGGTNALYNLGNGLNSGSSTVVGISPPSSTISPLYFTGSSDGQYLALFLYQRNWGTNTARAHFFYAGLLANVNTGFDYYSANNATKTISLNQLAITSTSTSITGAHYIANAAKATLQTGDAAYAINCSDNQSPTAQWGTDFYAFDNNTILGFPAIGRVRGMLLGTGTYTLGQPAKIQGSVFPDGGSPWYLPVGTFAGKTLLMRCYSSMD